MRGTFSQRNAFRPSITKSARAAAIHEHRWQPESQPGRRTWPRSNQFDRILHMKRVVHIFSKRFVNVNKILVSFFDLFSSATQRESLRALVSQRPTCLAAFRPVDFGSRTPGDSSGRRTTNRGHGHGCRKTPESITSLQNSWQVRIGNAVPHRGWVYPHRGSLL
jgi:hypothetical protein